MAGTRQNQNWKNAKKKLKKLVEKVKIQDGLDKEDGVFHRMKEMLNTEDKSPEESVARFWLIAVNAMGQAYTREERLGAGVPENSFFDKALDIIDSNGLNEALQVEKFSEQVSEQRKAQAQKRSFRGFTWPEEDRGYHPPAQHLMQPMQPTPKQPILLSDRYELYYRVDNLNWTKEWKNIEKAVAGYRDSLHKEIVKRGRQVDIDHQYHQLINKFEMVDAMHQCLHPSKSGTRSLDAQETQEAARRSIVVFLRHFDVLRKLEAEEGQAQKAGTRKADVLGERRIHSALSRFIQKIDHFLARLGIRATYRPTAVHGARFVGKLGQFHKDLGRKVNKAHERAVAHAEHGKKPSNRGA